MDDKTYLDDVLARGAGMFGVDCLPACSPFFFRAHCARHAVYVVQRCDALLGGQEWIINCRANRI